MIVRCKQSAYLEIKAILESMYRVLFHSAIMTYCYPISYST